MILWGLRLSPIFCKVFWPHSFKNRRSVDGSYTFTTDLRSNHHVKLSSSLSLTMEYGLLLQPSGTVVKGDNKMTRASKITSPTSCASARMSCARPS